MAALGLVATNSEPENVETPFCSSVALNSVFEINGDCLFNKHLKQCFKEHKTVLYRVFKDKTEMTSDLSN